MTRNKKDAMRLDTISDCLDQLRLVFSNWIGQYGDLGELEGVGIGLYEAAHAGALVCYERLYGITTRLYELTGINDPDKLLMDAIEALYDDGAVPFDDEPARFDAVAFGTMCPDGWHPCSSACACYRDHREGPQADWELRADPSTSGRCLRFGVAVGAAHPPAGTADEPVADDQLAAAGTDEPPAPTVDDLRDEARAELFAEESRARGLELS